MLIAPTGSVDALLRRSATQPSTTNHTLWIQLARLVRSPLMLTSAAVLLAFVVVAGYLILDNLTSTSARSSDNCAAGTGPDYSRTSHLAGTASADTNLSCSILVYADLSAALLEDAVFTRADLTGANLRESVLDRASFEFSKGIAANLASVSAIGSRFDNANLVGVDLSNALLTSASMRRVTLRHANLANADLVGVSLVGADLREADLSNANLTGADLRSANLANAKIEGANFTGVVWGDTICPDGRSSNITLGSCPMNSIDGDSE